MGLLDSQLSVQIWALSELSVKLLAVSQLSVYFDRSQVNAITGSAAYPLKFSENFQRCPKNVRVFPI